MAGVLLDAVFGGAKALGTLPAFETLIEKSAQTLTQKLARPGRSERNLLIRGMLVAALILPTLFGAGILLNKLVFFHPALTALATFTIAKFIGLKARWQQVSKASPNSTGEAIRNLVCTITDYVAFRYVTMSLVFITGGFATLLPYFFLLQTIERQKNTTTVSSYIKPFRWIIAPILWPGAFASSALFAFTTLFIPRADWLKAGSALIKPMAPAFFWPLKILAFSFNWSIECQSGETKHSVGPKTGRTLMTSKDLGDALIVTLVVFALSTALLMLPVLLGLLR